MFNFCMSINDNFASFYDRSTEQFIFVDSFDNHEFNVRFGTLENSVDLGTIHAESDQMLNEKLKQLAELNTYLNKKTCQPKS